VLMARVCGGRPAAYGNPQGVVVDANFSTLWPIKPNAIPSTTLLALLNSTWTWANLEYTCTVLGGGALKVEANNLRSLSLPMLGANEVSSLAELGRQLESKDDHKVVDRIDEVVMTSL